MLQQKPPSSEQSINAKVLLSIRRATLLDAPTLSQLIAENVRYFHSKHYTKEEIEIWQNGYTTIKMEEQINNRQVFVMEVEKEICGTIQFHPPEIKGVYINPKFRGMGYGNLLMNFMISFLKTISQRSIELTSNKWTLDFYKKHQFKVLQLEYVYWAGHKFEEFRMKREI